MGTWQKVNPSPNPAALPHRARSAPSRRYLHASQLLQALQEILMLTLLITAPILLLIALAEVLR
jgi:hypothetical protein